MARKDERKKFERRGYNPLNVGYTPRAPEGFEPAAPGSHLPKAPAGARTAELPAWQREGYPRP